MGLFDFYWEIRVRLVLWYLSSESLMAIMNQQLNSVNAFYAIRPPQEQPAHPKNVHFFILF